ncbi:MAG: hypothetical protein QOI42_2037 [Frankiaceae bacterium]|nr:hypothetical protein [Frankiaceae bacterium]
MAGTCTAEPDAVLFRPRFPFVPGVAYTVIVRRAAPPAPSLQLTIRYPSRPAAPLTEVVEIWPTLDELPRNVLRLYVELSKPMSEGFAQANVSVVDVDRGTTLDDALLPIEPELWDRDRRRLTVLFDPGRIKRGLEPHAQAGYPLRAGMVIDLAVAEGFLDGDGQRLRRVGRRRYRIGADLRGRVDPETWVLDPPRAGAREPVHVDFGRPLDHALLRRCLTVVDGGGVALAGEGRSIGGGTSWTFVPDEAWVSGRHELVVDTTLEDVAGNSVRRVFDRDLDRREDDPLAEDLVRVAFQARDDVDP